MTNQMMDIKQILRELAARWAFRHDRRRSVDRAAAVACRIALNGCRI